MNKTFKKLAQANVNRHDNNPTVDSTVVGLAGAVVFVGIAKLAQYVATKKDPEHMKAGWMADR